MGHKRSSKGFSNAKKNDKSTKQVKPSNGTNKMTLCTVPLMAPGSPIKERRIDRRVAAGKRIAMTRSFPGKIRPTNRRSLDPCDNSNDSGLGFDHHVDHHISLAERLTWPTNERAEPKRPRLDIKLEDDEVNENFTFPDTTKNCKDTMSLIRTTPSNSNIENLGMNNIHNCNNNQTSSRCTIPNARASTTAPITLTSQLPSTSRNGNISLKILSQPEQQHRARYQTEGSRGAVKDRSGNGFPVVKLQGYNKPATLQVFIGTDLGKVAPHMFYQACKVSGKNSTPCLEAKIDGTVVIEMQLDPSKDMIGTCDCVGILKERNVDVEHRFPDQIGSRSKKKSTRCRMVFRTSIINDNGVQETLQICSQQIVCTQPPGIPEICKKSLSSCPAVGGLELFILGKNFLKDTKVYFQHLDDEGLKWEQFVIPDKEFLQQTHLVCAVPPYVRSDITEPVTVRLLVVSSGKTSEPHQFVYMPTSGSVSSVHSSNSPLPTSFMSKAHWFSPTKHEQGIMPPPDYNQMPISQRRSSTVSGSSPEIHSPPLKSLKQELLDENSQNSNSILDSMEIHKEHHYENSLDVRLGETNLKMNMLHQNSLPLETISDGSITNINDNRNFAQHNESSNLVSSIEVPLVDSGISLNERNVLLTSDHSHTTDLTVSLMRNNLNGMDLRMKIPSVTVADLVNTNAPSLATLQSFGVTEATGSPLPTQTAQSIENYLSTIETKPINVEVMTLSNNNTMQMTGVLNATPHSAVVNSINQVLPVPNLLTSSTQLGLISSHLSNNDNVNGSNFNTTQQSLLTTSPVPGNDLIEKQVTLVSKLDRNNHSPQDMLISNKSPLLSTATQEILLHQSPQPSLLNSTSISPRNLEPPETNSNSQGQSALSSDMILNTQISPSLMCHTAGNTTNLPQENLLNSICQNNAESSLIQPPLDLPVTVSQQTAIAPLLVETTTPSITSSQPSIRLPNPLSSVMNANEPEKTILFNAAVDLLVTQNHLNQMDNLTTSNNATNTNMTIMNNILSVRSSANDTTVPLMSTKCTLQQTKSLNVDTIKQELMSINPLNSEKKNDDRMIPNGFATMSDSELINIINTSCFDQV